jgi:hypothetical protein
MNLKEIEQLINIRNYMTTAINLYTIDKKMISYLNKAIIHLDLKITLALASQDFKTFISFDDSK